jgi:probable blue pigment (indigoidine) exporter
MLWITAAWGACFVAIRWGLRDAPALWFATLRAVVAGVVLVAWGTLRRRPQPRGWPAWRLIGVLGVANATVAFGAMFAGVARAETGVAAVLANAQPLLILLPAWWLYGERVASRTVVAMSAGFGGLVIVAGPGGGGRGAWLSVLAAVGITSGTLLARRFGSLDVVMVSGWHFLIGGILLGVVAAATEGEPTIAWTPRFLAALGFLALIGTAAAFVAWFDEIQHSPLGPLVFGVGFGAVLLGERPGPWTLTGLGLVLSSLWFVLWRPRTDPAIPPAR